MFPLILYFLKCFTWVTAIENINEPHLVPLDVIIVYLNVLISGHLMGNGHVKYSVIYVLNFARLLIIIFNYCVIFYSTWHETIFKKSTLLPPYPCHEYYFYKQYIKSTFPGSPNHLEWQRHKIHTTIAQWKSHSA
jgi:hypothetical protein